MLALVDFLSLGGGNTTYHVINWRRLMQVLKYGAMGQRA